MNGFNQNKSKRHVFVQSNNEKTKQKSFVDKTVSACCCGCARKISHWPILEGLNKMIKNMSLFGGLGIPESRESGREWVLSAL